MGFALAEACALRGASVTLITGPVQLSVKYPQIQRISVESANEMYEAAMACFPDMDAALLCAAVADYRPADFSREKMKRKDGESLSVELVPNPDIAASLGKIKRKEQLLGGFALETNNEIINAQAKLKKKNLDFIVLNSLNDPGAGFQVNTNKVSILANDGTRLDFQLKTKVDVAEDIVSYLMQLMQPESQH